MFSSFLRGRRFAIRRLHQTHRAGWFDAPLAIVEIDQGGLAALPRWIGLRRLARSNARVNERPDPMSDRRFLWAAAILLFVPLSAGAQTPTPDQTQPPAQAPAPPQPQPQAAATPTAPGPT